MRDSIARYARGAWRERAPASADAVAVAGVRVDVASMDDVVDVVMSWRGDVHVAVGINAHVCNQVAEDRRLGSLIAGADLAYADGQSVVWAQRLFGAAQRERVATTDLIFPLAERCAAEGRTLFFLGGKPGVAGAAAERLRVRHRGLRIEVADGHGDLDAAALIERINRTETDVLLVGLGDPLQQEWIARHRDRLEVPAVLTCGGLFDWTSGANVRPPGWMIAAGLEWLWRLRLEPRRLARRYLVGNPLFVARVVRQLLTERR